VFAGVGALLAAGLPSFTQRLIEQTPDSRPQATPQHEVAQDEPWNEMMVQAGAGGHFLLDLIVNGSKVRFLLDTGASEVMLTPDDARRLGFLPTRLEFTKRFQTANGEVRGAPVILREMRIGQLAVHDVPATVNESPMAISLLGMSFLARLQGYEVRDNRLVLRW
jgi:aspartyl protease family protein